jgi:Flp pilus assembly protein TadB
MSTVMLASLRVSVRVMVLASVQAATLLVRGVMGWDGMGEKERERNNEVRYKQKGRKEMRREKREEIKGKREKGREGERREERGRKEEMEKER